jgi:hypothetical protein
MPLTSKVAIATTGKTTLRASIPQGAVEFLGLKVGDIVSWSLEDWTPPNGEKMRVLVVRKSAD